MPKIEKEPVTHAWTDDETEELLRAAVMDDDCCCYCQVCGTEISPIEPDADVAWCENCTALVGVEGLRSLGLV